jgi:hypothetical protein
MTQIVLDFEPGAFSALRLGPKEFSHELKTATVVRWHLEGFEQEIHGRLT